MDTFQSLGLSEPLLKAITETGYETPTPIQVQGIPAVLTGSDVLGIAQTGTGKTAAFALPILHRLAADRKPTPRRSVRALILSPTRELASQIADSFRTYGKHLGFSVAVVFGGVSERPQSEKLRMGVDILVATPGRLLDHIGQRNVTLESAEIFVLDEADQMLDLGFFKPIRRIVAELPKKRQNLFFSATMPKEIEELTRELLTDPTRIAVAPQSTTVERVSQRVIRIEQSKKKALLAELLGDAGMQRTLVFTRTKRGADRVAKHLSAAKIEAAAIHGNKSQNQREAALHAFKTGHTRVLVATDIAARGIDIDEVTHVVNFELPEVPEAYVHRIGRTARAGASGAAISFCDEGERHLLRDIERLTRQAIDSIDRRNDAALVADKPAGKSARESGEPRDGERPSDARRDFKRSIGRSGNRAFERRDRPAGAGDRDGRSNRSERSSSGHSPRPPRPDRPERRDGERGSWQSRNREGGAPRGDRPSGDRPRRDREAGDAVWTNDGSRPNAEHRGERRGSEGGRPPFRGNDRSDRRPENGSRPEGRREDRPFQHRGERSAADGERRPRSFDGPRPDRPHGQRRDDRPHQPRGDRPYQSRGERPQQDGERREWKPRPPRADGERFQNRGPRPEGQGPREGQREGRPQGERRSEGRPPQGERREGGGRDRGPRRDDNRAGGFNRDRPQHADRKPQREGGESRAAAGENGSTRPPGHFRKSGGDGSWRKRDDRGGDKRPPRREIDNQ